MELTAIRTRHREFLDEMAKAVLWAHLVALVSPYLPEGRCTASDQLSPAFTLLALSRR